jgi:hypothetical protein
VKRHAADTGEMNSVGKAERQKNLQRMLRKIGKIVN